MATLVAASQLTLRAPGTPAPIATLPTASTPLLSDAPCDACANKRACDGCLTPFARQLDALHHRLLHPPSIPSGHPVSITVPARPSTRASASAQLALYHAALVAQQQPHVHAHLVSLPSEERERAEYAMLSAFHDPFSAQHLTPVLTRAQRLERPGAHMRPLRLERPRAGDVEATRQAEVEATQRTQEGAAVLQALLALQRSKDALEARVRDAQRQAAEQAKEVNRPAPVPTHGSPLPIIPVAPLLDPLADAPEASKDFRARPSQSLEAARAAALEYLRSYDQDGFPLSAEQRRKAIDQILDPFATHSTMPPRIAEREEEQAKRNEVDRAYQHKVVQAARLAAHNATREKARVREEQPPVHVHNNTLAPHPARGFVIRLKDAALPNKLVVVAQPEPKPLPPPSPHLHLPPDALAAELKPRGKLRKYKTPEYKMPVCSPLLTQTIKQPQLFEREQALDLDRYRPVEMKTNDETTDPAMFQHMGKDDTTADGRPSSRPRTPHASSVFFHSPHARTLQSALLGTVPSPFSGSTLAGRAEVDDLLGLYAQSAIGQQKALTSRTRHWSTQHTLKAAAQTLVQTYEQSPPRGYTPSAATTKEHITRQQLSTAERDASPPRASSSANSRPLHVHSRSHSCEDSADTTARSILAHDLESSLVRDPDLSDSAELAPSIQAAELHSSDENPATPRASRLPDQPTSGNESSLPPPPALAIFQSAAHVDASGRVHSPERGSRSVAESLRAMRSPGPITPRRPAAGWSGRELEHKIESTLDKNALKVDGSQTGVTLQLKLRNNAAPAASRVRTSRTIVARASHRVRGTGDVTPLMRVRPFTTPSLDGAPFRIHRSRTDEVVSTPLSGTNGPLSARVFTPRELREPSVLPPTPGGYDLTPSSFMAVSFPLRAALGVRKATTPDEPPSPTRPSVSSVFFASKLASKLKGGAAAIRQASLLRAASMVRAASLVRATSLKPRSDEPRTPSNGASPAVSPTAATAPRTYRRSWFDVKLDAPGPTRNQVIAERQKALQWKIQRRLVHARHAGMTDEDEEEEVDSPTMTTSFTDRTAHYHQGASPALSSPASPEREHDQGLQPLEVRLDDGTSSDEDM